MKKKISSRRQRKGWAPRPFLIIGLYYFRDTQGMRVSAIITLGRLMPHHALAPPLFI